MAQLGKYEIIEEIGRGGFGVVYKALDVSLDRTVALKVLHPQLTVDTRFIENFKREARNLAKVDHPNVVNIYEINEVDGRLFIAMQYLPGGSLADRISEGQLEQKEALDIIRQVGDGLNAGHKQGIIHRDVKPSNILFDDEGRAIVVDFGVARAVHVSTIGTTSVSGGMVGTPYYRPPELWRGSPPPSPATDVYSLACVLYEMLIGEVLFNGETPDQVLTRHVLDEAGPLIENGAKDLPQTFQAAMVKALSKEPEDRFPTTVSFHEKFRSSVNTITKKSEDHSQNPIAFQSELLKTKIEPISIKNNNQPAKPDSSSNLRFVELLTFLSFILGLLSIILGIRLLW